MSSSSDSDSGSNSSDSNGPFHFFNEIGENGFAFEPEYSAEEVNERLRTLGDVDTDADLNTAENQKEEGSWCICEQCVDMENSAERVCCQSIGDTIGRKFDCKKCISMTPAFQDVCLNRNVLEAALGTWHHLTEQPLEISNKSFRFISYRQFISWVYGYLGKDIRKVVPSCVVNKIRSIFPAPDNIYVPYKS